MKNNKVSIIIPVYNAEPYIKKCVECIQAQTYKDFEIILVNDGSSDNSLEVCKTLAEEYSNIYTYNKSNGGVSSARNYGLKKAKGEYICFVDSDDYVRPNYLISLIETQHRTEADLIVAGFCIKSSKGNEVKQLPIEQYNREEFDKAVLLLRSIYVLGVPWNKLYIADIIKSNNIYFDINLNSYEDEIFVLQYMQYAKSIATSSEIIYDYMIYDNISLSKAYIEVNKHFKIAQTIYQLGVSFSNNPTYIHHLKDDMMRHYLECITRMYTKTSSFGFRQRINNINIVLQNVSKEYMPFFKRRLFLNKIFFQNAILIDINMTLLKYLKIVLKKY